MDIKLKVRDRIINCGCGPLIIAGNGDYRLVFDLDNEWSGQEQITARFLLPDGQYQDVALDENQSCLIPVKVLTGGTLQVGVYTDEMATTPCRLQVVASIKTGSAPIPDPEPSIYERLLAEVEAIHQNLEGVINDVY